MRIKLNEYVPSDENEGKTPQGTPKKGSLDNPLREFLALLDANTQEYLKEQCKSSPYRLAAFYKIIGNYTWSTEHLGVLTRDDLRNLSTAINVPVSRLTSNWKSPFQAGVLQDTINNSMTGGPGSVLCGGKARAVIVIKDGEENAKHWDQACKDYFDDNGWKDSKDRERTVGWPESDWFPSLLAAVRRHENGSSDPPSYEYGAGARGDQPGYRNQVRTAAGTLERIYKRWQEGWPPPDWEPYGNPGNAQPPHGRIKNPTEMCEFITACGSIYAPTGPGYPDGNETWPGSVCEIFNQIYFCERGTF